MRIFNFSLKVSAAVLAAALLLISCEPIIEQPKAESIAVAGTWSLSYPGGSETWIISDSSYQYLGTSGDFTWGFTADIVAFDNQGLNGGETILTTNGATALEPGYAVIRYKGPIDASNGTEEKYQIIRWATNASDSSLRDFTSGSKDSDPSGAYVNTVFDTPEEAASTATEANGFFLAASQGAGREN